MGKFLPFASWAWPLLIFGTLTAGDVRRDEPAVEPPEPETVASATQPLLNESDPLPSGAVARLGTKRFRPWRAARAVSFLPDGHTLVQTTSDAHIEHWNAETGQLLKEERVINGYAQKAAHTPDGHLAAILGLRIDEATRKAAWWVALTETNSGRERMRLEFNKLRGEHIAISADGGTIAVEGEKLSIIDTTAKAEVLNRSFAGEQIRSLGLSADGQMLAVGCEGKVFVWNWSSGEEPRAIAVGDNPRRRPSLLSVRFSPDGNKLAVGGDHLDGVVLFDVTSGEKIRQLTVEGVEFWYPRSLAFSRDGTLLAAPIERSPSVALWSVDSGKLLKRLAAPHESVTELAFSPDAQILAGLSSWSPQMYVWNTSTGARVGSDLPGHLDSPSLLRFLRDDKRLVSAGDDGTIRMWNVDEGKQERVIGETPDPPDGRNRWIRAMDVSPDDRYIASSSLDDTVRVWETDTGREVYRLPGHGRLGGRRAIRFTPDNHRLVSWGDDMRVYVWDVPTGKAVHEYRAQPTGMTLPNESEGGDPFNRKEGVFNLEGGALSPDASRLLLLSTDSRVFDVVTGAQTAKSERRSGIHTRPVISPDNKFTLAHDRSRTTLSVSNAPSGTSKKDHSVELRNLADGEAIASIHAGEGGSGTATFSHDGQKAAISVGVGSENSRILILSVPDLHEIAHIERIQGQPQAVEFSHSGKRLAVSHADTTIVVYDLEKLRGRSNAANSAGGSP